MRSCLIVFPVLLLAVTSSVTWAQCTPGDSCKSPDCRCWDDATSPGGFPALDVPQMVLISFAYAINRGNVELYRSLFEDVSNPNACPTRGTFFVQKLSTEVEEVKSLHSDGFEIGITTSDGTIPADLQEWKDSLADVQKLLVDGGIPKQDIQGFRSPQLFVAGDNQFEALTDVGLTYDSSCVSRKYMSRDTLLWPYTYDFIQNTPGCTIGSDPEKEHKGTWQFLIADLVYKGQLCATPSSCSALFTNSQDVFDFFYDGFLKHYDDKRTPFVLYLDPLWLTVDFQFEGTRQFLQFIQAGFDDTWLVTNRQALQWIQDPVSIGNITDFTPWQCK